MIDRQTKPARANRSGRDISGILLVDKPGGQTSNRVLQRVKRLLQAKKAGHTGSLDPLATGMLPICLGQATKVSSYLLDSSKGYRVRGVFGIATDTGDADGQIVETRQTSPVGEEVLKTALHGFVGEIRQVPPMYSALKHQGRRLYDLARQGIEVERAPRRVRIYALNLEAYAWPEFELKVHCSKGTYIRSLVVDLAQAVDRCAHVMQLRRLWVDPFDGEPMHTVETLEAAAESGLDALDRLLLLPERALPDWPRLSLSEDAARSLLRGQRFAADGRPGPVRLYGPASDFLGIGEIRADGLLVSRRLFVQPRLGDG